MTFSAKCWKPRLAALAVAASLLAGCGFGGSDGGGICAGPPVVEYDAKFQARAAAEVEIVPADSALSARPPQQPADATAILERQLVARLSHGHPDKADYRTRFEIWGPSNKAHRALSVSTGLAYVW